MIEQITDKEQLEELLHHSQIAYRRDSRDAKNHFVRARLQPEVIEMWKHQGYFRFIKSQLQNLNIKFACTHDDNGTCEYYFIFPSRELKNRAYHMLNALWTWKEKKQLVKCEPVYEANNNGVEGVHGTVKACPLF